MSSRHGDSNYNFALLVERKKQGKRQLDIAKAAGINFTTLSMIANGHIRPRSDEKEAIASVLGVSVESLFSDGEAES